MKTFHIQKPDEAIKEALIDKINNLTKPKGSLGRLEEIALQIGLIQQSLSPRLTHPQNIIFAADHGIVEEKVSPSPKEVTWQQISNFLHGGAGINFLCRQHGFTLKIVDAGVDYDLPYEKGIINMKVGRGTRNFLYEAAMKRWNFAWSVVLNVWMLLTRKAAMSLVSVKWESEILRPLLYG